MLEIIAAGGGLLFAFDHATIAGKLVLTLLAVVSIFSWSIMVTKLRVIRFARKQNARFLAAFRQDRQPLRLFEKNARFFVLTRLCKDEVLEFISGEGPLAEEYRSVEVGLQGYFPGFQFALRAPVPLVEIVSIQRKASRGFSTRRPIPSIREDHSPDIPE